MKQKVAQRQIRLAIASNAGGSGKTTMAIHLAYGIGARGYKVTLIELDHNGSLSVLAGLPPSGHAENSLAKVLSKDFQGDYPLVQLWEDRVSTVSAIQGGAPLEAAIANLYSANRKHYILGDRLEDFPLEADVIIFDTPASLEPMGLLALAACTHVLAPIKPEYKDTGALAGLLNWYYEKVAELRLKPRPEFLGFVPSRVDLNEAIHRNILGLTQKGEPNKKIDPSETLPYQIQQLGIHCFQHIRESSYYLWASGAGLPLNVYRPGCSFYQDYDPIINTLIQLVTE
ncbi:MAG TPA: ParA family protein [Synechococcales cyanobacterium M55_K2018_004]|nr:ParA family protein [Synechococcales cyanobacterium M55_K2018_004]